MILTPRGIRDLYIKQLTTATIRKKINAGKNKNKQII